MAFAGQYAAAGRRSRLAWSDGFYVTYDYDNADELTAIHENGGTTIASFGYDDLGRRTSRASGNGTGVGYGYDPASRLTGLTLTGGASPTAITLGNYNPAGQIGSRANGNDAYAWTAGANTSRSYTANGLNQYATIAGAAQSYDPKGNMTALNGTSFTYGIENTMTTGGSTTFLYDALNRLVNSSATGIRFDYDDDRLVSETNTAGQLARRYVFGPAVDEPLVWYEGTGTGTKRYLDADERGSVIRVTDGSGGAVAVNSYDDYGQLGSANVGRFEYTGQVWLPEIGQYYYKARMYSPVLGRFMQPDPIGFGDGLNLYSYAQSDPINATDPSGLVACLDCVTVNGVPQYDVIPGLSIISGGTLPQVGFEVTDRSRYQRNVPPPTSKRHRRSVNCSSLSANMGPVDVATASATAIVGGGVTGSVGKFWVPSTGASGYFFSLGGGSGADIGASITGGRYTNLGSLSGFAATFSGGGGDFAASRSYSSDGRVSAMQFGLGIGGLAGLLKGASLTFTGTSLFRCSR